MAKSNLDEVTDDILAECEDDDEKAFIESIKEMVLAGNDDIREEIQESETFELNEAMAHHAKNLVVQYAGLSVKIGQESGLLDANGQPTEKMPPEVAMFLDSVTKSLEAFKEMYVKVHGEAAWATMSGVK